jgi:hypothetical protein
VGVVAFGGDGLREKIAIAVRLRSSDSWTQFALQHKGE